MRLVLLAVIFALALASSAYGHSQPWYWAKPTAEQWLEDNFEIGAASCYGFGVWHRKKGRKLYKHFRCGVAWGTNETDVGTLHVLGKYRAVMKWG